MRATMRRPATRAALTVLALLLSLLTTLAVAPGRAQASTVSCPAGWQLQHFSYQQHNSPLWLVTVNASVNFYYCTGWSGQPTLKQFPGGQPNVRQNIDAASYSPLNSVTVRNVRSEPIGIAPGRCDVPHRPGLNTPCYRLTLRTTADVDHSACLFLRGSLTCATIIRNQFASTVTVAVSPGHGAWWQSARLGPV